MLSRQALPIDFVDRPKLEQHLQFKDMFNQWIHSSNQKVDGLPKRSCIVSGITDAFNQLYGLYNTIGIFEGEYGYHQLVNNKVTYDLSTADCIVISHPFSANGNDASSLIEQADKFNKPIFIDCAFFGICSDIDFDFTKYKNIHSVCFSLSKTFGTGLDRVGLLFTKDDFPCLQYSSWQYPLITQSIFHFDLLKTRSPDWACATYKTKQIQVCDQYNLTPSSTVIFGLDYTDKYSDYSRGNVNRICISKLLNDKVEDVVNDLDRVGQTY